MKRKKYTHKFVEFFVLIVVEKRKWHDVIIKLGLSFTFLTDCSANTHKITLIFPKKDGKFQLKIYIEQIK